MLKVIKLKIVYCKTKHRILITEIEMKVAKTNKEEKSYAE